MRSTNSSFVPPRVTLRPDPAQWHDDELMTLQEAAALFWPDGPLTTTSLRTAIRDGKLEVAEVAGKLLTNKAEIAKMTRCAVRQNRPSTGADAFPLALPQTVTELRRLLADTKR